MKTILPMRDVKENYSNLSEEWRDIKGFEGRYFVSNLGRIKTKRGIRKFITTHDGYDRVVLYTKSPNKITINVHKVVAQSFIPNPHNKPQINHLNGNKKDNRACNLEWCTAKENIDHAIKIGLIDTSDKTNFIRNSILSIDMVLKIYNDNSMQKDIAKKYNVSKMTINDIKTGRTWSHVTGKVFSQKYKLDR